MTYYKSLDSIRAFAVFLVIFSHWLPFNFVKTFHFGYIGVDIFFVLSGFLITNNLLKEKKETSNDLRIKFVHLKNFIIRRSLRIFPVYYFLIFVLAIIGKTTYTTINENIWYYITYTSNILFFNTQKWDGMLSHLWSLAVEEQFYLIWPWLIIFVPQRHVFKVIFLSLLLGILSNFALKAIFPRNEFLDLLTPTCFDAFAIGGIWAYIKVYQSERIDKLKSVFIKFGLFCLLLYVMKESFNFEVFVPNRTFISIVALALIIFAIEYKDTLVHRKIFENNYLMFVGKISYGIYLFHSIIPWIWNEGYKELANNFSIIECINTSETIVKMVFFIFKLSILLGFCWFSFTFFENPINKLKHKFK